MSAILNSTVIGQGVSAVFQTNGTAAPDHFANGLPYEADGSLAVAVDGAIAHYHQGLGFTSTGRLAVTLTGPPARFNSGAAPMNATGHLVLALGANQHYVHGVGYTPNSSVNSVSGEVPLAQIGQKEWTFASTGSVILDISDQDIQAGDVMWLHYTTGTGGSGGDAMPVGWTQAYVGNQANAGGRQTLYYKVADGTETSIDAQKGATSSAVVFLFGSFRGAAAPVLGTDLATATLNASAPGDPPPVLTAVTADDIVLTLGSGYFDELWTPQANYTLMARATITATVLDTAIMTYRDNPAVNENPGQYGGNNGFQGWVAHTIAVRKA